MYKNVNKYDVKLLTTTLAFAILRVQSSYAKGANKIMQELTAKLQKQYGYRLGVDEIYDLYQQGELSLTDSEENALLEAVEAELNHNY